MVSVWADLGAPPQQDEIEVTVLGPGYGEAVIVHLGNGEWLLADSCVDPADEARHAAPLKYLRALNVPVDRAVQRLVVSHWDDDHVGGIAEVVEACSQATFCCPIGFTKLEFAEFLEEVGTGATATEGGNVSNFRRVLRLLRNRQIYYTLPGRQLYQSPIVKSWSPSDYDFTKFLEYIALNRPRDREAKRKAIPGSRNVTSVVLSIDWPHASVLLGADMLSDADSRRGWKAIVSQAKELGFVKGNLVKIPHHGSDTGHEDSMWSELLNPTPISIIAPFGRGAIEKRPPKPADIRRISKLSSATFLTAGHRSSARTRMNPAVKRSIRENGIVLTVRDRSFGIARFRKTPGGNWKSELFGSARKVG